MTVPISLPICRKAACIGREKTSPGDRGAPRTAGRRRPRPTRALRFSSVPLLPPGGRSANLQAEQRRARTELFATESGPNRLAVLCRAGNEHPQQLDVYMMTQSSKAQM